MWVTKFVLLFLANSVSAYNILAVISLPLKTHYKAFENLFLELANRGHNVTILKCFPSEKTQNIRYIDLDCQWRGSSTTLQEFEEWHPLLVHFKNFNKHFGFGEILLKKQCELLLTNPKVKSHLEEGNKYDVIFVEQFLSECDLAYAGTHFDAPIIGLTSTVLLPWTYSQLGIPFDIASDTSYLAGYSPKDSRLSKFETAVMHSLINIYIKPYKLDQGIYNVFKKHVPKISFDINRLARDKMKMVFAYQHYSMTGARLLAPQLLEVAGMHITDPKPVPQDLEDFLSNADHGVIYVSFGSNLRISGMSPKMLDTFLAAFKQLPQKFLVKWELDEVPAGHSNILWRKWFPQLDLLCHPKVVAFISHVGMLGTTESAYCGKPILAIPFFGDQLTNAAAVKAVGLGKTLTYSRITTEILVQTIKELTSPEMQQSAQRVSRQYHDRPQSALDSAVFWTEYVARHASAPPSLPSKDTSMFESLMLDIILIFIIILLIPLWLIYIIFKCVFGSMCKKKEKRQ